MLTSIILGGVVTAYNLEGTKTYESKRLKLFHLLLDVLGFAVFRLVFDEYDLRVCTPKNKVVDGHSKATRDKEKLVSSNAATATENDVYSVELDCLPVQAPAVKDNLAELVNAESPELKPRISEEVKKL